MNKRCQALLGLSETASISDVRDAYQRFVGNFSPEKTRLSAALEEKFLEVTREFAQCMGLADSAELQQFLWMLRRLRGTTHGTEGPSRTVHPPQPRAGLTQVVVHDLEAERKLRAAFFEPRRIPEEAAELNVVLELVLSRTDARDGGPYTVRVPRRIFCGHTLENCGYCGCAGHGHFVKSEPAVVHIPPGSRDGDTVVVKGLGHVQPQAGKPGAAGWARGTLFLKLHID